MTVTTAPIPSKSKFIFLGLLVVMFFAYRYPYSIQKGPYATHMWRQSDCLSWAKNYLEDGFHFFKPAVHWTKVDHNDRTVGEFPILFYLVSLLLSVFGKHEFIFLILNLLIIYLGLYYVFKFTWNVTSSSFWALFTPIFLFTSPVLAYYGNNFIVNAPSFGLALIALYQYWKYLQTSKVKFLIISCTIYLIAGLLKVPALISFTAVLFIQSLSQFRYFRDLVKIPRIGKLWHFIPMAGVILAFIIWVLWAREYNHQNISGMFELGIRPIWDVDLGAGLYLGTQLFTQLSPSFFNHTAIAIILALFTWVIIKFRNTDRYLTSLTIIIFIGVVTYMLIFFQGFTVHDYYLTNLLVFIPLVLINFLNYLKQNRISLFYSKAFRGLAIVALLLLIYNTMVIQRMKYDLGDTFVKHTIIVDENTKRFWGYHHEEYERKYKALTSVTPYLRELGIKRTDPVLSLPDGSPNITLYMMDQKGRSGYGLYRPDGTHKIDEFIESGIQYLIINDPGYLNNEFIKPYIHNKIGEYENIQIFKLSTR